MIGVVLMLQLALAAPSAPAAVAELQWGHAAFQAGDYREAVRLLDGLALRLPRNGDYALYLQAESDFYVGAYAKARAGYEALGKQRVSRFAQVAPWRVADCLWMEGRRADAGAAYRRLLKSVPATIPATIDPVVARFRLAELASPQEAAKLFRQIHVDSPAHPLAEEAMRRSAAVASPTPAPPTTPATSGNVPDTASPRDRLKRATGLAEGKHYQEALAELEKLPADLPPELTVERDFETGMAKYHMRRDYARAAALLLGIVPRLSGEKAAFAAFHGARALSRADRDDEAIVGYRKVVEKFPSSHWAPEAQFRSGWLDFNRGRYRESLPGLNATLARYGKSAFANDAAWFIALAHFLLDEPAQALPALEQYARLSGGDADAARRVLYWRARILAKLNRGDDARALLRECVRRWPLDHYGLLARGRLKADGQPVELPLEKAALSLPAPKESVTHDPVLQRADELLQAGLAWEAGFELERGEEAFSKRVGREQSLPILLDRYPRMLEFHRAYQLASARGGTALAMAPTGAPRVFWEAAYPRAFRAAVEKYGPPAGNPDYFLYAIMRKESGFAPYEVSYADARGLLQVIPDVGQSEAARVGEPFFADQLYDAETNIRFGAAHIGSLVKKFNGQIYLAAGAYNAGARPVMRWCDLNGKRSFDEFVELITYDQTREYVKRVIGLYAHYRYLYSGDIYELPPVIDGHYTNDGPSDKGAAAVP